MSEVKGILKSCDRCGETIFLKTIGDGEADGLDDVIRESRTRLMVQGEIVQRVAELNKARRERLGTKG